MHPRLSLVKVSCVLLALIALVPGLAAAQGAINVTKQDVSFKFGQELNFELQASSSSDIKDIVLLYQEGQADTTNRRVPQFTAGQQVTAKVTEKLQRGEIPPGTDIKYHWQIKDAAGNTLTTPSQSLLYMDDRFKFDSLTQDKVTVYWQGADQKFGQDVMSSAQEALARLEKSVGVQLDKPIRIIVYQTKSDMMGALPERGTTFDDRITTLGIVVAPDIVLLLGQQPDLHATIAHELTHVVVGLATKNPYADIPAWLNEGLAMWNESEGELRGGNKTALDAAVAQNHLHTVRTLTAPTGNPAEVNLWYGEVFSIVDYLLKQYGPDKMSQLLATFKKGAAYDDALQQVYGFNQDGLDARWRESLGLPPRAGAAAQATAAPGSGATPSAPGEATPASTGEPSAQQQATPVPVQPPAQPAAPAFPSQPGVRNSGPSIGPVELLILAAVLCCGILVLILLAAGLVFYLLRTRPRP